DDELHATDPSLTVQRASAFDAGADDRVEALEAELATLRSELEAARSAGAAPNPGGKTDKEFFALKETANKKDKEIVRLKGELNEKDREIVELKDRETTLEQEVSHASSEIAQRDAQIKANAARLDQAAADRKKVEQQWTAAKDEARGATARVKVLETELKEARAIADQMESIRAEKEALEDNLRRAADEAESLRGELANAQDAAERDRAEGDALRGELEQAQASLAQAQADLESAEQRIAGQSERYEEELGMARKRLGELEEANHKHEERVAKLYTRIKGDEKNREKTKKALSIALQLLDEQAAGAEDVDEEANA
ncbi:MAG TPA: hypothetical protein VEY30_05820, partial [Myxococcaceae bacterium]|nr:hypothetical protein [Myxococcaceae bacterium]